MWIYSLRLNSIRSFEQSVPHVLSKKINLLLGQNNSGKSTIIRSLAALQDLNSIKKEDIRLGTDEGRIEFVVKEFKDYWNNPPQVNFGEEAKITIINSRGNNPHSRINVSNDGGNSFNCSQIRSVEPNNFIFPFLAQRKVFAYDQTINRAASTAVTGNFQYLAAKIDKITNPAHPNQEYFVQKMEKILGFRIGAFTSDNGKHVAFSARNSEEIPISSMGEGVAHIVGLIADLAVAKGKLFLIEELENDIHPGALKDLLDLIIEKSQENQFIISTHSNIVLRALGAETDTKVFTTKLTFQDGIPVSSFDKVESTVEARQELLESLGYDASDFNTWKGWIFFEESSAERLVREYLIPWFFPKMLGKVRTFGGRGISTVERRFRDFNDLFVFIHLDQAYKNRAWVMVDAGVEAQQVLAKIKGTYCKPGGWNENRFLSLTKSDIEFYFPACFQEKVREAMALEGKVKDAAKKSLFDEVIAWIDSDQARAKTEFQESASEILNILKDINEALFRTKQTSQAIAK